MEKVKMPPRQDKAKKKEEPKQENNSSQEENAASEPAEIKEEISEKEDIKDNKGSGDGNILSTEEVNLGSGKNDVKDETTKVNYVKKNFMSDFVKKDTKESDKAPGGNEKSGSAEENLTPQQIKEQIEKEEKDAANSFSREEIQDFAEMFVEVIDMAISTGLRFYAKDTSTAAYELAVDKKRKITRMVTNLFCKYQTKFSIEFMVIITIFICYSAPAQKAHKMRKEKLRGIEAKRGKGQPAK